MNERTVNTREFLRNYKKITSAQETIIIANHGKPEGVFIPYEEWEKKIVKKRESLFFTQELLDKYIKGLPKTGARDTSQKIDEILYKNFKMGGKKLIIIKNKK
ncbi:MAG: hypothetical protein NTZ25_02040 [Candidatus Peregrinibacteria bacterium]|nr:hypothetical protein [Candidatus Peregrinibacteria bacterium]